MNELLDVDVPGWDEMLSWSQQQFVLEYVANGFKNASKAALAAGYSHSGTGHQLMRNKRVLEAVNYHKALYYQSRHMGRDRILFELANMAGFDMGEIMRVDENGDPHLDLSKATEEHTRVLKEIETTTERLVSGSGKNAKTVGTITKTKVKTHDKLAALRLLMQHLGMIQEGVQVQVNLDFGERMAMRRAKVIDQTADLLSIAPPTKSA